MLCKSLGAIFTPPCTQRVARALRRAALWLGLFLLIFCFDGWERVLSANRAPKGEGVQTNDSHLKCGKDNVPGPRPARPALHSPGQSRSVGAAPLKRGNAPQSHIVQTCPTVPEPGRCPVSRELPQRGGNCSRMGTQGDVSPRLAPPLCPGLWRAAPSGRGLWTNCALHFCLLRILNNQTFSGRGLRTLS